MTELIIHNAKVYLEEGHFAEAVLVRGDRIAAVGTNDEILPMSSVAKKIDAQGCLLLPGFNDSHLHLYHFGRDLHRIQARGATSIEEIVQRGREFIQSVKPPKGSVITGTGWDQDLFVNDKRLPNRHDMDRISTDHAVIISRICGHIASCNTSAMEMAGITKNSVYAAKGEIELGTHGEPLGFFGEGKALFKLRSIVPPFDQQQIYEQLLFAVRHALENGLTTVGSTDIFDDNFQSIIDAYIKIFSENDLHLRVSMQCCLDRGSLFDEFVRRGWKTKSPMGHPYLTMGAAKLFADGSLGSRTAFLRQPYRDDPSTCGNQLHPQEEMDALVKKSHDSGFQVIVHAIGDAAIEEVLNSFEKVTGKAEATEKNELRHGIVHCQITDLPFLQRMADNDILAFMQPIFLSSDLYMLENRVGKELAATSYAHATMKKLGVKAAYGTDCPVESMSPLECIDCAVNRHDVANGYPADGFNPAECVTVSTAVDAYTAGGAYAEFAEDYKGRIKAGYLADMTLLDRDIFSIPRKEIRTTQVLWTMVGGKIAYQKDIAFR